MQAQLACRQAHASAHAFIVPTAPHTQTRPPVSRSIWAARMGAGVEGAGSQEGGGGGRRLFVGGISKGVRESELAAAFEQVRARVREDSCVHGHDSIHALARARAHAQ